MSGPAGEFERLLIEAEFEKALRAVQADVPYTRELEGYPSYLLFTDQEWDAYDSWNELQDRLDAKYGWMLPRSYASVRATGRGIW